MGSLLTIEGLHELEQLALSGKPLPNTWKNDIERSIIIIEKMLSMKKQCWLDCQEELKEFFRIKEIIYAHSRTF